MTDRVVLRVRGRMPEKFLAKAAERGILIGRAERTGDRELRVETGFREARRLLALAEEYRLDAAVVSMHGRPVWLRRIRERSTLSAGIMLGLMILTLFTSRIWRVEAVSLDGATGGDTLTAIEQFAADRGAGPGAKRGRIDREALSQEILLRWPELTHAAVKLRGVCLTVETAAEEPAPEIYDGSAGRDLVALRDAAVLYVEPLAGRACVREGDVVKRGQLLICGEERISDEAVRSVRALGSVIARVWFEAACELPLSETVRERTGRMSAASCIRLGGWKYVISAGGGFACEDTAVETMPVGGLYLPLLIERTARYEVTERTVQADKELLKAQGEAWALETARSQLPEGAEESGYWFDYAEKEGRLTVRAVIEARMQIAGDREALRLASQGR